MHQKVRHTAKTIPQNIKRDATPVRVINRFRQLRISPRATFRLRVWAQNTPVDPRYLCGSLPNAGQRELNERKRVRRVLQFMPLPRQRHDQGQPARTIKSMRKIPEVK